jgi:hypothetical protein
VRLRDGRTECALCGAALDIPEGVTPTITIHAASGRPNIRVISIGREEIHRCQITPD